MAVVANRERAAVVARLDDETRARLDVIAEEQDRSLASLVRIAVREFLARYSMAN